MDLPSITFQIVQLPKETFSVYKLSVSGHWIDIIGYHFVDKPLSHKKLFMFGIATGYAHNK